MQQRRVPTVQTVQEAQKFHGTGAVLGSCRYARRCATTGARVQSGQAALESHSCTALAVGTAAVRGREGGGEGGLQLLSGRRWELITQVMSSITLRDCLACNDTLSWTYTHLSLTLPLVYNDRCLVSECTKLRRSRSCSTSDKVVDVPAGAVHRRFSRPCDHAATLYSCSASDSIHRPESWTVQLVQQRMVLDYVGGYGGDDGMAFLIGVEGLFRRY